MTHRDRGIQGGLIGLALAATAAIGCSDLNTPLYFKGTNIIDAAGNDDPLPTDGVTLRFRRPTMQERMKLQAQRDALGYDMDIPWVSRDKVHVEVSYKVTNMADGPGTFTLFVDGASQYARYDTQMVATALQNGDDPPIFLPLITTIARTIDAGKSFSGIVREDDFAEGELDLDALVRWNNADATDPTFAGVLINRSDVDAIGLAMIPGGTSILPNTSRHVLNSPGLLVVPALYEIDLRLKTDVHMQCEYFVRVRDDEDRLWHNDADDVLQPDPTLFQPPAMM
ncbi:MAG TPA: hypothetical protein VN903_12435 [Polyangia bacterium]|jgi:hypothetical protein|nr:hypothetical protein [Polyangia bacterium]